MRIFFGLLVLVPAPDPDTTCFWSCCMFERLPSASADVLFGKSAEPSEFDRMPIVADGLADTRIFCEELIILSPFLPVKDGLLVFRKSLSWVMLFWGEPDVVVKFLI